MSLLVWLFLKLVSVVIRGFPKLVRPAFLYPQHMLVVFWLLSLLTLFWLKKFMNLPRVLDNRENFAEQNNLLLVTKKETQFISYKHFQSSNV